MLEHDGGVLRRVSWREICPWLDIVKAVRLAISPKILLLGALGVFLMFCGWALIGWCFSGDESQIAWMGPDYDCPWNLAVEAANQPVATPPPGSPSLGELPFAEVIPGHQANPFLAAWSSMIRPLSAAFDPGIGRAGLACSILCGLWSLAVWGLLGGAITRIAAVQLAADERIGLLAALRYAGKKWTAYFAAPLCPLIGCLIVALPLCGLGLLIKANWLLLLLGIAWPLWLLAGLIMVVLLLGLVFGWPLMFSTISVEGTDSFDALSRSYAYTFQRPLHYLFYVLVAAVVGALGWIVVDNFADGVVELTYWSTSWGTGQERIDSIKDKESLEGIGKAGAIVVRFWASSVRLLAVGFFYGFFWAASTAIYFQLRRNVDATETDECYLDEDATEPQADLPIISADQAGAPVVEDAPVAADDVPEVTPDPEPEDDSPSEEKS